MKGKTVAVIGYGSQGHAHANNLRDSGLDVVVGLKKESKSWKTAEEAGYQPEIAYYECLNELKLIVDLIYEGGLGLMRYSVSDTAQYGDLTRGPRVVTDETKEEMRRILKEVQSGEFAREWILENRTGRPVFNALNNIEENHPIEKVGGQLRAMMSWLKP